MKITFKPSKPNGTVFVPSSKSYAHRSLICGAFSENSVINNVCFCDDVNATLSCLEKLGTAVKRKNNDVLISGFNRENVKDGTVLECSESGSTLRFLIPVCLTLNKKIIFKGSEKLFERPLENYFDFCKSYGFLFDLSENSLTVCGDLKAGNYAISGEKSSQFVSGLLMALGFIEGKSILTVTGNIESKPYIDITVSVLKEFGIEVYSVGNVYTVYGKKTVDSLEYTVEGDCTAGAYLEAFNLLGNVNVAGINNSTIQGDFVYIKMFSDLIDGKKEFNLKDCPDLAPIMFSASLLFGGGVFYGTERLAFKESNRSYAMAEELSKFGAKVNISEDFITIEAKNIKPPTQTLSSHNDHRIAMALSFLCAKFGGTIKNAEVVNKSFPDFYKKLIDLGICFESSGEINGC